MPLNMEQLVDQKNLSCIFDYLRSKQVHLKIGLVAKTKSAYE